MRKKRWADDVKKQRPRCAFCNSTEELHAHHVLKFEVFEKHRQDLSNGMVVCKSCHIKIHTPGGSFGKKHIQQG